MRKTYLLVLGTVFTLSSAFVSCGDSNTTPVDNFDPREPAAGEAMSPASQKEYLELVAKEFMDETKASDFNAIADLYNYVSDTYTDNYDWDAVDKWGSDIYKSLRESLGTTDREQEKYTWGEYNYIYTNYKALLKASNFTGHFTATNGKWTLTKANDLQFIFNDKNGQVCVLKLETSGSVKKVYLGNTTEWVDYYNESSGGQYISNEYYDRTQLTIGVPENIVVTLTQGGNQVVKTTVKVNIGGLLTDEKFDISKNELDVSTLVELNNGYKFNFSQIAYNVNSKASVSFEMSKNGKSLALVAFSSDLSGIPSCNIDAFVNEDCDDVNFDNANMKNVYVKLDILGKVQILGTLSDARQFADYLDSADANDKSESEYKSYVNQANSLLNLNLCYNGKAVKQATVKLEPFSSESWGGTTHWKVEPVLNFYDGSSYSTFEAFFNDKDFKSVIDTFEELADKYAALFK